MNFPNEIFFNSIRDVILTSRQRVYRAVNFVLLETYWNIGKLIVEEEQQGESRAAYGSNLLKNLSLISVNSLNVLSYFLTSTNNNKYSHNLVVNGFDKDTYSKINGFNLP
mgnify:CR=1 FL=1